MNTVSRPDSPRPGGSAGGKAETKEVIKSVSGTFDESMGVGLDEDLIVEGRKMLHKLETNNELMSAIVEAQKQAPVRSQKQYITHIGLLEKAVLKGESVFVDKTILQYARDIITRSKIECLLSTSLDRVKHITKATSFEEQDMFKIKSFLAKAESCQAHDGLIREGSLRLTRMEAELEMSRAIAAAPVVRLPINDPPPEYWQPEDIGKIVENEGFPLPPEGGEYVWEHSASYTLLLTSIERLRGCSNGADKLGANPALIQEAKELLVKSEKGMKLLDAKDAEDKRVAVDAATKAAKKLKKGKKKK